jgi:cytochrome c-type biogenesis protein CcmE
VIMGNKKLKFVIGIAIIVGVVAWEAVTGFQQNKTYYVTVSELVSGKAARQRVRVGGSVAPDSIKRHHGTVTFRLAQNSAVVPVVYVGSDTLPDTFRDGAQAIVEGQYASDGTFRAEHIQAKCASKYQAVPGRGTPNGQAPPAAKKVASSAPAGIVSTSGY